MSPAKKRAPGARQAEARRLETKKLQQQATLYALMYLRQTQGLSTEGARDELNRRGGLRLLWQLPGGCLACGGAAAAMTVSERPETERLVVSGACQAHLDALEAEGEGEDSWAAELERAWQADQAERRAQGRPL